MVLAYPGQFPAQEIEGLAVGYSSLAGHHTPM